MENELTLIDEETNEITENPPKYVLIDWYDGSAFNTLEEARTKVEQMFKKNPYMNHPVIIAEYKEVYRSKPAQAPEIIKVEL